MSRVLALDLGSVRIGVAASDPSGVLASPVTVLRRAGDRDTDHAAIRALVDEYDAERVVVGVPYSLDGRVGAAASTVLEEIAVLEAQLDVPVERCDERFTTTTAHQALQAAGRNTRARRDTVDAAAAAVLLQTWLDRPRSEADE
jgi:putative Holliday junction resolvase